MFYRDTPTHVIPFPFFWDIDPDIATTAQHTTLAFSVGRRLAHYCLLFRIVHNGKCGALNRGKPGYRKAKRIEKTKSLDGTWNWTWGTKTKNSEQSRAGQGMYCSSGLQELDLPFLLFTFLLSPPWNWSARHWQPDAQGCNAQTQDSTAQDSTAHITNIYPRILRTQASNGLIWWIWNQGRTCHKGGGGWVCTIMCMYVSWRDCITIWRIWIGNWRRVRGRY